MTLRLRHLLLAWLTVWLGATACLAETAPAEVLEQLPGAVLSGKSRFTVWGFEVYNAALWVQPGFRAGDYERHGFALDLSYLRAFSNEEITNRSLDEMRRQDAGSQDVAALWRQQLREAFPDVRKGDRITGVHRPGEGAIFLTNGKVTGIVRDPEFSRRFFGIWLSPNTSEPKLRKALLARAPAR